MYKVEVVIKQMKDDDEDECVGFYNLFNSMPETAQV